MQKNGGAKGSRTPDLLNAIQALYQLSYGPNTGNAPSTDVAHVAYSHARDGNQPV
jgi:hypothetical protein